MKKLEIEIISYKNNEISFLIKKQRYRLYNFYPKDKLYPWRFVSSDNYKLRSSAQPEANGAEGCNVLGSYMERDNTILTMSLEHFKLFYKAMEEYNEKR